MAEKESQLPKARLVHPFRLEKTVWFETDLRVSSLSTDHDRYSRLCLNHHLGFLVLSLNYECFLSRDLFPTWTNYQPGDHSLLSYEKDGMNQCPPYPKWYFEYDALCVSPRAVSEVAVLSFVVLRLLSRFGLSLLLSF